MRLVSIAVLLLLLAAGQPTTAARDTTHRPAPVDNTHLRKQPHFHLQAGSGSGDVSSWTGQPSVAAPLHHRKLLSDGELLPAPHVHNATAGIDDGESDWVQSLQQRPPVGAKAAGLLKAADVNCPGCVTGYCYNTEQGYRCTSCQGSLFVSRADGTCGCPAGRYNPADGGAICKDCEKSFFCVGGKYIGSAGTPPRTSCGMYGDGLTTLGLRSVNKKLCVNLPGYLYSVDLTSGDPTAAPCPVDTYGPGLRKQRACPPCPSGYTTLGKNKQTGINNCAISAGYFQVAPGRVAPCPKGTWKSSPEPLVNCTKCAGTGVTTPGEAATSEKNCSDVIVGYFATSVVDGIVKAAAKCPQKCYCPGGTAKQSVDPAKVPSGDPTIVACPRGTWTQGLGTTLESSCLTPPGHYTSATDTQPCADGQYRPGWVAPDTAAACLKCSPDNSISSMATDVMTIFKPDGTELATTVKGTDKSCYILGGQGLVSDAATNTMRAINCDNNNWGVSDNTFGLNPNNVCKNCPANLVTNKNPVTNPISSSYYKQDTSKPPKGGFTAAEACVSRPGWGVVKGVATPCAQGFWSPGDTMDVCTQCEYGLTTSPNNTQSSDDDCVIAPGYGFERRSIIPCPVGTYNDQIRANNNTPCTPCPGGSSNTIEGATSKDTCNLCKAGYGGSGCNVCGGDAANYGPGIRPVGQECVACPGIGGSDGGGGVGGYSFLDLKGDSNFYTPRVIAVYAATQPTDCIGEFTQIADNAWNLEPQLDSDWGGPPVSVELYTDCLQLCQFDTACQFVQFDYGKTDNNCRLKTQGSSSGSDHLAFKAVSSTDMGASSVRKQSVGNGTVQPQAVVASGKYTIWKDSTASRIGRQEDPPQGAPLNYNSCLLSCDADNECAGVFMTLQAINLKPLACKLIYGDKTPGVYKRAMTRMVADADHQDMYTILGAG